MYLSQSYAIHIIVSRSGNSHPPAQIPEYCTGHDEEAITAGVYQLIFAFDECISVGYKENVTIAQVKTFTEMDSHEEKLQKIIMESKMNEARDEARRKADTIEQSKCGQFPSDPPIHPSMMAPRCGFARGSRLMLIVSTHSLSSAYSSLTCM